MSKKVIGLLIAGILATSVVGCSDKAKDNEANNNQKTKVTDTSNIESNSKTKGLQGEWANKEFTYSTFKEEGKTLDQKIEEQSRVFGLEYKLEDSVVDLEGTTANIKSIYVENKNPEPNKLESMKFETQFLGESQESGRFQLKMSLKFDSQGAKEGKFNLADTSIAKYAQAMTGVNEIDYSNINNKIKELLNSEKGEGFVEDSVNGIHEEIGVNKEYLLYTLTTPVYKFKEESQNPKA